VPIDDGAHVLVVDDEADLRRLLEWNLREAGFAVSSAANGEEGLAAAERVKPAVIVLDLMLPDLPGTEVCRRLRAHKTLGDGGILMLTARKDDYDRIVGFELGADDYVVKPFNVREVMLRVRALARRVGERRAARGEGRTLAWRDLVVDTGRHRVKAGAREISLRPLEFRLLTVLLDNAGSVLSRERLLAEVWDADAGVGQRTVDTHVKRLRQALGEHGENIETVVGFGYRFPDP
jgi:two-component system phosphate regulon response regulator PhoB